MPRYEPVEVANFEFPPPDPDPQAVPVFENSPLASAWIHPVDPPREEKVGVPFESMVSAERVEVAKEVGLEVARYKFPPAFRKVQLLLVSEPSERASWGAVLEASWRR